MRDRNWMKFAATGRVDDYLTYCRCCHNSGRSSLDARDDRDDRNEDEDVDESECYPDRDGAEFHARG